MNRHLLSSSLLLLFLLTSTVFSYAAEQVTVNDIVYDLIPDTGDAHVYRCNSKSASIEIPETIEHEGVTYNVTQIGNNAFAKVADTLESIKFPPKLRYINKSAFYACKKLTELSFPSTLISIDDAAFAACWGLENLTLPEGFSGFGQQAFYACINLKSVSLPASFSYMGGATFACCYSLEEINVSPENENYTSVNGALYNKDVTLLTLWPSGVANVELPSTVTAIGGLSFFNDKNLTEINIPESVESIHGQAFEGCTSLVTVSNLEHVTFLGAGVFRKCSALKSIVIPALEVLGRETFGECTALEDVQFAGAIPMIDSSAFKKCTSLKKIVFPEGVIDICSSVMDDCEQLEEMELPSTLRFIRSGAFSGCTQLKTVVSRNPTPPSITHSDPFTPETYANATLRVPQQALDAYREANYWKNFIHMDVAGIEAVPADDADWGMVEVISLDGRVVYTGDYSTLADAQPRQRGVYIIREISTGKTAKMLR